MTSATPSDRRFDMNKYKETVLKQVCDIINEGEVVSLHVERKPLSATTVWFDRGPVRTAEYVPGPEITITVRIRVPNDEQRPR